MVQLFPDNRLVIASHNEGKVREIAAMLSPYSITVLSAAALNLPEPVEDGDSFLANAEIKSRAAAASGSVALADDSGLVVVGLDGAPGIHSARWAGSSKDFVAAMERIRTELSARGVEPQGAEASFVSVLSLCYPDGFIKNFVGEAHGTLTFPPRGDAGFGYDPIFIPDGFDKTYAEIPAKHKNQISHRARAFALFVDYIASLQPGGQKVLLS